MDIGKTHGGINSRLSNFTARKFNVIFEEQVLECNSMEGFLQGLKFENPDAQRATALLVGFDAKRKGRGRNKYWQTRQTLWFLGTAIQRKSKKYAELITVAYDAMYEQSESLRLDLKQCKNVNFTHSIGNNDASATVLTESEFCKQIRRLRDKAIS